MPYEVAVQLSDAGEAGLRALGEQVGCDVFLRGNLLTIDGDDDQVAQAATVVDELVGLAERGHTLDATTIPTVGSALGAAKRPDEVLGDVVWQNPSRDVRVTPKTAQQKHYADAIRRNTVTFGIGPAGTGKTFLAVAAAADALARHDVKRIILTRPAVEAGERLGFLPGDLMQKIDPYLRPLFDALHDMLDPERVQAYLESGVIEVAPLAFMRGRTLNDAFIILDEAQNTTPEQMKMFLTRLGYRSKMVVTGDVTQVDLPRDQRSGLIAVAEVLDEIDEVEFVRFDRRDVVRNRLVQKIVDAYDQHAETQTPELVPAGRERRRA